MSIVARSMFQLRSLPIPMRWEVTRRNPYYCTGWKLARAEHRKEIIASPEDAILRPAAVMVLGRIGVSGEPPDPATPFSALGAEDLKRGWLSGAVHPITMRGLAAILLAALPKQTAGQLGMIFLEAACEDVENRPPKKIESMQRLTTESWPGLDDFPNEPFVSINPAASERKIGEAIDQLLKQWKGERGLDERRERTDKYEEYLEVWDLREGWHNGVYDRGTEQTFAEIAAATKRSISTLCNQYCRAFELIVGQPYSRELWLQLFGPIKLTDILGAGMARTRRPTASPTRRPVPESVVSSSAAESSNPSVVATVESRDDAGYQQLLADLTTMLELGRTDAQICEELDVAPDAVVYLRQRGDVSSLRP